MDILRQWMEGRGGCGIIYPQHCEGTDKKNPCWEKRGWFRDNLQSRCANCGSTYLSYYWVLWLLQDPGNAP